MASDIASPPKSARDWKSPVIKAAAIFLAAMFVYIPAMQSKWIWDDNLLITQFPVMQHKDGLRIFWASSLLTKKLAWMEERAPFLVKWMPWLKQDAELADMVPDYYPITWSTLWLEWKLWGNYPAAYHVTNCVMHAIGAVLVWVVLAKLSVPGAFLSGLIFAVHPVNVCSVAWISERKNVVSILFFLLTFLFYFHFEKTRRWWGYILALVMFLLAMLSKASVVMLPVVLLLADWWRRSERQALGFPSPRDWVDRGVVFCLGLLDRIPGIGGVCRRLKIDRAQAILADLVRTAPFFLLAYLVSKLTILFQTHHVIRGEEIFDPGEGTMWWRIAMAGLVPWFYLYKALIPTALLMIYPRWHIYANVVTTGDAGWAFHPEALWDFRGGAALVLVAVALLCLHRRRWARHVIFGLGYFLVLLFPIMGFYNMYFLVHSLVADHWQYLSIIGVIALVAGGGTWFFQRQKRSLRWAGTAGGAVVVGLLAVLTWNQTLVYEDQITLWRYNLPKNPDAWMGQYNLGTTLAESAINEPNPTQRNAVLEEALRHLIKATELRPTDDAAQNNAGLTLMNLGRYDEALTYLHRAAGKERPFRNPQAALNLALTYRAKGDLARALEWAQEACLMYPRPSPDLYITWAEVLLQADQKEEALAKLSKALDAEPRHVEAWYRRGLLLKSLGRVDEALADFQQAVRLQPNAVPAMVQAALILNEQGRRDEAIDLCTQAVLIRPGYVEARYRLGLCLLQAGRFAQAVTHLSLVVQAEPSFVEARGNLALALARMSQLAPAIAEFRKVLELKPDWVAALCDLARLLAIPSSGPYRNLPQALELAERACRLTNYDMPLALETLAMVHSEAGRFDQAVKFQQQALGLMVGKADEQALTQAKRRMELYKSQRPYSAGESLP